MSYGWLTESSILPKKSKKIDVQSKTFIDLKVNLLKDKEKLKSNTNENNNNKLLGKKQDRIEINKTKFNFKSSEFSKPNEIENPNKLDKNTNNSTDEFAHNDNPELSYEQMKAKLLEKQKIYEKLSIGKINQDEKTELFLNENSLIDFGEKRLEIHKDQKPKRRTKFDIVDNLTLQEQKEKYEENNFDFNTPYIDLNERFKVKQSYDKKLTDFEKDNLEKIIDEEKKIKEKLNYLKKKKEIERLERIERIKTISFPK